MNYLNDAIIQLNWLNWRDFEDKVNPVACALMSKMEVNKGERTKVKLTSLNSLTELDVNSAKKRLLSAFIDTYLELSQQEQVEFEQRLAELEPTQKEKIVELTTSWMIDGERRLLSKQLNYRFGELSPQETVQIASLSGEQLEQLAQDFLDFKSREELSGWLGRIVPNQA